jgi:predicted transcriptional regulator of viral defense system
MPLQTHRSKALTLASRQPLLRARDFAAAGVPRTTLTRLAAEGALQRTGRGLYAMPGGAISAHVSLAETALAVPRAVIVLASALRFHDLTTQLPHQVWIMLPSKAWAPTAPPVRLRIFRSLPDLLMLGVELHRIDGVDVLITSPARTIVDCFKHRNSLGLDVAIEALRDGLHRRKTTHAELDRYAAALRMERVMRPYKEALIE